MFLFLLITFLITLYLFATKNHNYWAKRNVKHETPIPFFGNHFRNFFRVKSIIEISTEYYNKYTNEKVVGYYRGRVPELIVRDHEIAKRILVSDFAYFYKRGLGRDVKAEPALSNLFHVDGDLWRLLRHRLTPAFTSAKLRAMFPLVVRCAEKLQVAAAAAAARPQCDVRELMARFTSEFIGACGFGLEFDAIDNENSEYRNLTRSIFSPPWHKRALVTLFDIMPEIRKVFYFSEQRVFNELKLIFKNIRKERNGKPSPRNDFIDLLLELENKGSMKGDSIENVDENGKPAPVEMELDVNLMAAQVFIFLAAGFETSSSATSYTLHQLAYHPEIQEKVQQEIDAVYAKYNNKLCLDAVTEMSLLAMSFKEAMRIFPSLGNLHRVCTMQYIIPELNLTIDPGVRIIIPIQGMQNDAQYFENPDQFIPERFAKAMPEKLKQIYMPFGMGPRACIGTRLGEMQSLAGLAALLHKCSVQPAASTRRHPFCDPSSNTVQSIKGGLPLRLVLRE